MATAYNRDYQKQKEDLYLKSLDLTFERHQFAMQWFGTFDPRYTRAMMLLVLRATIMKKN